MSDSWCRKIRADSGNVVSGGAARNVRISRSNGMDEIIEQVARRASRDALLLANIASRTEVKPRLRLVKKVS